jgi:hypothetical protein
MANLLLTIDEVLTADGEHAAPAEIPRHLDIAFADYIEKSVFALEKLSVELESLQKRVYALERRGGDPVGVRVTPACLQLPDAAFMKGR